MRAWLRSWLGIDMVETRQDLQARIVQGLVNQAPSEDRGRDGEVAFLRKQVQDLTEQNRHIVQVLAEVARPGVVRAAAAVVAAQPKKKTEDEEDAPKRVRHERTVDGILTGI